MQLRVTKVDAVKPPNHLKYIYDSVVVYGRLKKTETVEQQRDVFQFRGPDTYTFWRRIYCKIACNFLVTI